MADLVNARPGTSVYALKKFGIGAFSESVRQEVLGKQVRRRVAVNEILVRAAEQTW